MRAFKIFSLLCLSACLFGLGVAYAIHKASVYDERDEENQVEWRLNYDSKYAFGIFVMNGGDGATVGGTLSTLLVT
jgi:hypothetical protein